MPEKFRVKKGSLASDSSYGNNGCFIVSSIGLKSPLRTIASDELGWEHCSVSVYNRCPTWQEMSFIKDMFWDDDDCVMQLHPPKSDYVDMAPYCLHLWRPIGIEIPRPPSILVGFKNEH